TMQRNTMEDFRRDISYRVLKREDGQLSLTALLRDRFHEIEAEVVADLETLKITAAGVDIRRSPTPDCGNIAARMNGLVGFTIGKGLSLKLRQVFGGGDGCGNIRNLLIGLLPLALNVRACTGILDERQMLDTIHEKLRGACVGYAGPVKREG
ncbi:MAG TPA: DUF2889 domain-containing protein, partial [Geobacteraceae bacterium]